MSTRTQKPSPILTDNYHGLTNEQIFERFPAVFADQPHESRGSRYMFVPTYNILDGLREEGFIPTTVMHQRARVERPGLQSHGKHLIRFRHVNDLEVSPIARPEVHEVVLINSHNGTSSYQFMSGMFRFICENGCVFADLDNSLKVRHTGSNNLLQSLLNATFQIARQGVTIMEEIEEMKQIMLSWDEQITLAEAAMATRLDGVKVVESDNGFEIDRSLVPFQPQDFLRAQRIEDFVIGGRSQYDAGDRDLHTTYQVLQENLVERPILSSGRNQTTRRRSTTHALKGIEGNVKVNAALWYLTKQMAEIKSE